MGIRIEERAFTLAEVTTSAPADCEVFSASTTKDLLPVVRIGAAVVGGGRPGPVTLALLDAFRHEQSLLVGLEPPPDLRQIFGL
jgi:branched-subunit amino acid aminotransferase/4-amino-4-deoxychorismate lyase